ncbi:hypothetical protein GGI20_003431 [Coemansia sp. BCRC 34301]|nr:hypothetical protein GGI20_003431 [Coemansia sp. BCRC 34301]
MAFRGYAMSGFGNVVDMPPPDWCITTLRSLTTKYEHLSDSRKVKPPFAEAVLNSFKSKLLNFVSSQALYDSDEISDGEAEWPMAGDCSAPFIDLKPADYIYDGDALAATGNYLTVSPADIVDSAASHCSVSEESSRGTGLIATSPSSTSPIGVSPYAHSDCLAAAATQPGIGNEDNSDLLVTLPPSIEEALRRFLADSSDQLLSETFTTFADAEGSCVSGASLSISASPTSQQDADSDDDHHGQFFNESGSCSPESIDSSEDTLEFIAAADSVDVFVKNLVANNGSSAAPWDATAYSLPAQLLEAGRASSDDEEDDETELPPCKRKRRGDMESKDAKAILRNSLPISPRKRSRSVSRRRDAAAVPTSSSSGAESPPPLLNLCISTSADATPTEA